MEFLSRQRIYIYIYILRSIHFKGVVIIHGANAAMVWDFLQIQGSPGSVSGFAIVSPQLNFFNVSTMPVDSAESGIAA